MVNHDNITPSHWVAKLIIPKMQKNHQAYRLMVLDNNRFKLDRWQTDSQRLAL